MPFEILRRVTDAETGRIDRDAAAAYNAELLRLFRASPEWQARPEDSQDDEWVDFFLDAAVDVTGLTAAQLAAADLRELLDTVFPVELYYKDGEPAAVIDDLRTLYSYLEREFGLPSAGECRAALGETAVADLRRRVHDTAEEIEAEGELLPGETVGALEGGPLEAADAALERANEAGFTDDEVSELAFALADRPEAPSYEKPAGGRGPKPSHTKAKRKMAKDSRKKNRKR